MKPELFELLFNALNEQGYLLQESCEEALKTQDTGWEVRASEYPVSLQGEDTRVDMILRAKSPAHPEFYAVVECKRADPEYVYWLFGAPGLHHGKALCHTLGVECSMSRSDQPLNIRSFVRQLCFGLHTYDPKWWVEVREGRKGSTKRTSTPQNIETAFGQALKGVAGIAQEQIAQRGKAHQTFKVFFVPVVITTAPLYVAYYEPKDIDLSTGKISKEKCLFGPERRSSEEWPVPWVLVDYGAGENVAPKPVPETYHGADPAELQRFKIRSIFVVNSRTVADFFLKLSLVAEP